MSISKTKRITISPKKEKDIFDEGFEVIYEGDLPNISIEEDDYRDVLCGLSDIDHTDYIRKNDYDKCVTESLGKSDSEKDCRNKQSRGLRLPNFAKPIIAIGKAGGKALKKTIQLILRTATLILIASITFLLGKNFLVNLSSLGSLSSLAATQNPAMIAYLIIAAVLLFYEIITFLCVLFGSNKRNRKGNNIDSGRGLFSFIFIYLGAYLSAMSYGWIPQTSQALYGIQTALLVYGSMQTILLPLCTAGIISCILRKFVVR